MKNYQVDLGLYGESIENNYPMEEVKNSRGFFRHCKLFIGNSTFILDKKGVNFFNKVFNNGQLIIDEDYLARRNRDKIEYFHREFAKYIGDFEVFLVVHHKNFKKEDNRNCNLKIMSEEEHNLLHEERKQLKIDKAITKYIARGERIRERYEKRGERIRANYISNYPNTRRKKAHSTFIRKFKESNPSTSWKTASYKWKKFKEKKNID